MSTFPPALTPDCPGAPVLASVSKGVPGIFMDCHMMVSEPEKVRCTPLYPWVFQSDPRRHEWVNDIADAGGSLYCFHIEATCQSSLTIVSGLSLALIAMQRIPSLLSTPSMRGA